MACRQRSSIASLTVLAQHLQLCKEAKETAQAQLAEREDGLRRLRARTESMGELLKRNAAALVAARKAADDATASAKQLSLRLKAARR
jgi:hypothetical protein